jgi:hypothetical protein
MKLLYASLQDTSIGGDYVPDRIHLGCDLDLNNWSVYNFWLDGDSIIDRISGVMGSIPSNSGMTLVDEDENILTAKIALYDASFNITGYFNARIIGGFIFGG